MAYVNFETEEAALAAFELNTKNPMSKIKVAYYEKGSSGQVAFTQAVEDVRGNTNYRVLFVTKINKRVSVGDWSVNSSAPNQRSTFQLKSKKGVFP